MTSKKNAFWRFIFSLLPGAGEMYMGFLKMGVSTMGLFFASIMVPALLGFGAFAVVCMIIWFYSFFHVHNLASLSDEEFYSVEDDYIFPILNSSATGEIFLQNHKRTIAIVLIFIGVIMTWRGVLHLLGEYLPLEIYRSILQFSYALPKIVVGIAIIALGVTMIRGKKQQISESEKKEGLHGEKK